MSAEGRPRSQVAVGLGVGAAVLCAGRCAIYSASWCWGPRRAEAAAAKEGVELTVRRVSVLGPTTSPLSISVALSGVRVDLEGAIGRLLPCSALGGGEVRLGRLELCISPLSGSARLIVRDVEVDVTPLTLEDPARRDRRLRQAQRAAWRHRHLMLDAAMQKNFWRRQAAVRAVRRLSDSDDDADSSDDENSELDGREDDEACGGTGVALLRPRRDLDLAPPVRRGWLSHLTRTAVTRYLLGVLDRTEVLVQNVRVSVHSMATAASPDGDAARSRSQAEAKEQEEIITVRLEKLSLGQAPHAADRLADDRVIRDPPTAVPTHEATLGRRSAWVRRDPLSPELTLSAVPMQSVWTRNAKASVSPTVSLSLLKERLERWFPAASEDRRVDDQRQFPVTATTDGPVSLLPSIHTLSAIGLTVQREGGSDEHSCTVLQQKMLRVDIAACVDEFCWMRSLDFIVLDAVNIAVTPLKANAALAPIVRAFAHGKTSLRYAHHHLSSPASPSPERNPRTPGHSVQRRSVRLWQFACRCVQQELRRVRPSAAVRWSKLAVMFDYQKQWLHFIAQAHRIGPSGRSMLQLIVSLARETLASITMPVADYDEQREGNRLSRRVLVSREHADEWATWVRNRRGLGVTAAGHTRVAAQVTKVLAADLAAAPEPSIQLWARRRHLILATVELVMLETQPATIGDGAADGGGYMMSTDEIITVRERAMLDHPLDTGLSDWVTSKSASTSTREVEGYDGDANDIVDVAAAMGMPSDLRAECVVSVILRELHVSLHPGPAHEAATSSLDGMEGVFCHIGEVGVASRVTANYDPHEIELAVGQINAVENTSRHTFRSRDHSRRSVRALGSGSTGTGREFLSSGASSQFFILMRSCLNAESRSAHTAVRVSRLTLTAHLPVIEELARVAERSAVEMFSTRADASRRLDEYVPLVQPQPSATGASFMLSHATTTAIELIAKFMVAVPPPLLPESEQANGRCCSWLIPATDQAGIYLLQSRCCSHRIELDIDGPSLSITQGQTAGAPQLTVWSGMVEANYATSGTPSGAAFRGGTAEAETTREAFRDALPRASALRVRKRDQSYIRRQAEQVDGAAQGQGDGLLFGNADACWSGFSISLTHTLGGVPTVIRFNQEFQCQVDLSSCVLPRQFSALCGVPVATLKCNLERVDFKAAPPDLVYGYELMDRANCALQMIGARFWPIVAQDPQSFHEGFHEGGALGEDHEIPDDITLQRADAAQKIRNPELAAAEAMPKADIPGPHRKPRSRPPHAVRWDGSKGDWLDDDGHVALPPPLDDSEFCADLMSNSAIARVAANRHEPRYVGAAEHFLVDQAMLEVVVIPPPMTFTLQQNRGRPLLLVALNWDNVHVSHLSKALDWRAGALDVSADMSLQAHFDNAHLARWEPVVEPWRSKVTLQVSSQRCLFSLYSEGCLDINLSPAFLQGLWFSWKNHSGPSTTLSKPFDNMSVTSDGMASAKTNVQTQQKLLKLPVDVGAQEVASDLNASPYWLRNSCGSTIEVRLRAGREESGLAYLPVANQERVALDAADYGAPALDINAEGIRVEDVGGCDLHVRFQHEGEQVEYVFKGVNRVDTHQPREQLVGRPDVICYVHITSEGRKVCEVCSRLRVQNRTRRRLEFGFSESATAVVVNAGETGYAPPQYYHAAATPESVFVRPSRDFEWAEMQLAGQDVHRGVARCERIRSGRGLQQDVHGSGFTACFSCALLDEQRPVSVLTLFDALTLQNMIPSTVTLDVFSSAGETAAETSVSLEFGETYVVPNWLPTQPAWLAVTDCCGATSQRTLIHEAELDKSWAKVGATPEHELGHVGMAKCKVGALKMTANVESSLRLRGGAFAVKHVANGKLTETDHFDVAVHHTDLVDAGHTVSLHVTHCVINRTEYPLYMKTDSKGSFVVVPAWTPPSTGSMLPLQENPIMLPCWTQSKAPFGGDSSLDSVNVRFGCPVQQVWLEDSTHRFVLLSAAFKRNTDAFGSDDLSSYAKVVWNSRVIGETEQVRSTRFPVWNKSMPINLSGRAAPMTVAVYDRRKIVSDSLLGEALVPIEDLRSNTGTNVILPLFTPSGRQQAEAAEAKRAQAIAEQERGQGDVRTDISGVWRATSADQLTTEYILLREGRKCELTGSHVCGTGDAFVIQAGKHDHEGNDGMEIMFEQVYEQDGARVDWVGTLTTPNTMVGTWHGTGIHGSFDAVRLRELDYADLAVGFLTLRLEDVGEVSRSDIARETNRHHDDVHHFVGNWSDKLPLSQDLAVGAGLPPITIDAGPQGKRQLGIYVEPPAIPLAPMVIAIVPRFVFFNCSGAALMLVDVDSAWMATIESGEHCEGFTAPRQALNSGDDVRHRLVVRKLRSAGVFVDSEIINVEEPGVKWGIFPVNADREAGNEAQEDAADVLTHLADDIHAHCQLDEQGTMVVTLRKAADVEPPYHIVNLSNVELEYRPKLEAPTDDSVPSAADAEAEPPRYRKLGTNKTVALHEHLWPRNRSHTTAGKVHRLEVRIGGEDGETRVFSLDTVNDRCPKWEVTIATTEPGAGAGGRIRLRPQVLVDRQGLSLRFSTTRTGGRWIDHQSSKIDVQMLGGMSISVISAQQSHGHQEFQVQHQRQELMYGRLHGIRFTSYISDGLRTVELIVAKAQLDDQVSQQVVLRPRLSSTERQLHFCMARTSPSTIDRVDLSILPFVFTLKYPTAKRMFLWWKNIFDGSGDNLYPHSMQLHTAQGRQQAQSQAKQVLINLIDPSYKACIFPDSNSHWQGDTQSTSGNDLNDAELLSPGSSRNGSSSPVLQRVYIKSLRLRHVQLECTIDMVGAVRDPMASELLPFMFGIGAGSFSAMARFTFGLATKANSVNRMRLNIDEFERSHWFDTSESAFTTMHNHYSEQTMRQLCSLRGLASLDIFGAPLTKVKIVSESAHEGWLAVRDRDGIGMALSGVNMGKELVANTLTTASTMTQAFSGTLKNVIGDEVAMDMVATTNATAVTANVGGARDGVTRGGKLLREGLLEAVAGVVEKPMEGLQRDGGAGLVRGTGEGLLGLVLKPVAAVSDFVSASTEGLARTLDSNPLTDTAPPWAHQPGGTRGRTMRSARSFGQFGELREFSPGDVMLRKLADRRRRSAQSIPRHSRHQPGVPIRPEDEKCLDMLVETTALPRHEHSQLCVTVTLLTECSLVQMVTVEAADSTVARALQLQAGPQFHFATVISEAELGELIHSSRAEHWEIVEDRSLQDLFSASFDATDQTVALTLGPRWDGRTAGQTADQGQERVLRLSRSPRIVDDAKTGEPAAGSRGGVRDLLRFMGYVVKTASHHQGQTHTLVDITNADTTAPGGDNSTTTAADPSVRVNSRPMKVAETRLRHSQHAALLQEGVAMEEHGWLLVIYLTEVDSGHLYNEQPGGQLSHADWRYSLEVYNVQDGVIHTVAGLTAADSAAIELQGHHKDCRLRVRRYLLTGTRVVLLRQAEQEGSVTVLDADLPRVGLGAGWRRDWHIEDLNDVRIDSTSANRSHSHAHRFRHGEHQQPYEVIDLTSPQHGGGGGGGGGVGGVSCLSAEGSSAYQHHRRSSVLADLIVEASMEHCLLDWSIPARVVAEAATQSTHYSHKSVASTNSMYHTHRQQQHRPQLTPVLDTSHDVVDLTSPESSVIYSDIEEVEAQEARVAEMIDAAMEGDVETLAGLASQDTAMLHARLPLSNSSTNSGALANEFTGDATATALWLAACKGHAEAVRWLLTRGADGSTSYHCTSHTGAYSSGCTALHAACIKGHSAVVRALVCDPRVNLNSRAEAGRTAAHCAAERGHMECLRLILHEGRRRGPPAPSVAAAMAMRTTVSTGDYGTRGDSQSVREALDAWYYNFASSSSVGDRQMAEKTTERDFLLSWVDAQNPTGISADE